MAVRCRTATAMCRSLMLRGGEPVIGDPGCILVADEFLALLAKPGQGGSHAVRLPACLLCQIADCRTVWPFEQRHDRCFLREPSRARPRWPQGRWVGSSF